MGDGWLMLEEDQGGFKRWEELGGCFMLQGEVRGDGKI